MFVVSSCSCGFRNSEKKWDMLDISRRKTPFSGRIFIFRDSDFIQILNCNVKEKLEERKSQLRGNITNPYITKSYCAEAFFKIWCSFGVIDFLSQFSLFQKLTKTISLRSPDTEGNVKAWGCSSAARHGWWHHKFPFVNVSPCCFPLCRERSRSRGLQPTSALECLVASTAQLPSPPKYHSW